MIEYLFQPTTFLIALLQVLIFLGLGAAAWYAVWYELDKKKDWFIAHNTNTGRPHIFRARPGHEGIKYQAGTETVFVKLESNMSHGVTKRGQLWQFDSDTGQAQRFEYAKPVDEKPEGVREGTPIPKPPSREGTWNGLDGKWWLRFIKAEMESRVTSAAGGNLEQLARYILIAIIVLAIPICVILWKVLSGFGSGA